MSRPFLVFAAVLALSLASVAQDESAPSVYPPTYTGSGTVVVPEEGQLYFAEADVEPLDEAEAAEGETAKPMAIITDINGNPVPSSIATSETLFLSALQSTAGRKAESFIWIVDPKSRADRARVMDSGRTLVVGVGDQEINIEVTLVVAKGDVPAVANVVIPVRRSPGPGPEPPGPGPVPPPIPPPNPPTPPPVPPPTPPNPVPVPPDPGQLGLSKLHYDHAMSLTAPRRETALKIASLFENAAGVAAAISTMTAQDLVTMTNASLKNKLTQEEKTKWDKWRTDIYIKGNKDLADAGLLPDDKNAHLDAWEEIVIGLRAVTD